MSNDYTLPPVPSLRLYQRGYERFDMEDYGHACAEHVRAPLLARIAELEAEAERERLAQLACDAESSCFDAEFNHLQDENGKLSAECDRLRAEVEALRADAAIEFEPGRTLSLRDLLTRAVRGVRVKRRGMLWPRVAEVFCLGSSYAHHLCRWAGRDPDTGKDIAARKGEGVAGA